MALTVRLDELLSIKQAGRHMPDAIAKVEREEVPHLIITRHGKPLAVLLSIERYEQLLRRARAWQEWESPS